MYCNICHLPVLVIMAHLKTVCEKYETSNIITHKYAWDRVMTQQGQAAKWDGHLQC